MAVDRARAAGGRRRPVRRADGHQPGRAAGQGGRADPRHQRREASTWPRTANASTSSSRIWASPARRAGPPSRPRKPWPIAERVGYPVLVRPSYVLGGRAMEIVYHPEELGRYIAEATSVSPGPAGPGRQVRAGQGMRGRRDRRRAGRPDPRAHGAHRAGRGPLRRQLRRLPARHPDPGGEEPASSPTRPGWPERWKSSGWSTSSTWWPTARSTSSRSTPALPGPCLS